MKQLKIITLLITASMLLCACPDEEGGHRYITIVNKSNRGIFCQVFWSGHITAADTLFQCGIATVHISADSLFNLPCGDAHRGKSWEYDFKVIPYIQFLIMDDETYKQYWLQDCDTIRKYVPILHCYQLTLDDLQRMNWTVTYPPSSNMSAIKMYPPYQ